MPIELLISSKPKRRIAIAPKSFFYYSGAMNYSEIITMEPGKRGGKPCIRGLRITVYDVLEYLASGMSQADVAGVSLSDRS